MANTHGIGPKVDHEHRERVRKEALEWLEAHPEASRTQMTRATGYSAATISYFLNGKYEKSTEAVTKAIAEFLRVEKERAQVGARNLPFVETSISRAIFKAFDACHVQRDLGLVTIPYGLGKTYTCREYVKRHPGTVYLEVTYAYSTRVFFSRLCQAMGLAGDGNMDTLLTRIIEDKQDTGHLILIDQAEFLPPRALTLVHTLFDEANTGIVMLGLPRLRHTITSNKGNLAQLCDRIGVNLRFSDDARLNEDDVIAIVKAAMPGVNPIPFVKASQGRARKLRQLIQRTSWLAKKKYDGEVTPEAIAEAATMLIY